MFVVTFYSYCGGVGRTTALVNAAIELAHRGRNVLVVDFDLQKPALTGLAPFVPPEPRPGVMEFIAEYLRLDQAPNIAEYLFPACHDLLAEAAGKVWVMPAGREDDAYWNALGRLDWNNLYDSKEGFRLFEYLRQRWQRTEGDRPSPDYVLIDTHLGFSPQLETCTCHLADGVVVVFTPDRAAPDRELPEIKGLRRVHQNLNNEKAARLGQTGEGTNQNRQDLAIHFVASKIPERSDEAEIGYLHMDYYAVGDREGHEVELEYPVFTIPFAPGLLLDRKALVRQQPETRLADAFRKLVNAIMMDNYAGDLDAARVFLKELQDHPESAIEAGEELYGVNDARKLEWIARRFANNAEVLAQVASCYFRACRFDLAFGALHDALELRPNDPDLLWQRASYYRRVNRPQAVKDLLQLIDGRPPRQPSPSRKEIDTLLAELAVRVRMDQENDRLNPFELPGLASVASTHAADSLIRDSSGLDPYLVSALHSLLELAPDRYEEARQRLVGSGLSPEDEKRLFSERVLPSVGQTDPQFLLATRQWELALTVLESRVIGVASPEVEDVFFLFMAWWGAGNEEILVEASRRAIDLFWRVQDAGRKIEPWKVSLVSAASWKIGDKEKAERFLDVLETTLKTGGKHLRFSFWRCRQVSQGQFLEDCAEQRKMIRGLAILPPFLGR